MTRPAKDVVQRECNGDRANENTCEVSRQQGEDEDSHNDPDAEACEHDRHVATVVDSSESAQPKNIDEAQNGQH